MEKAETWEKFGYAMEGIIMLVLSRRPRESIRIGSNIQIKCLEVRGNQVKLGITAPDEVVVDREEVYLEKLIRLQPELIATLEVSRP